jgi:diaminopimelate epimerase
MQDVTQIKEEEQFTFLNTGSPHHIEFVKDTELVNVVELGKQIRYNKELYPEGTNVNFVQIIDNQIKVRTYERGVEDETLSCGTGVVASSIATYVKNKNLNSPFEIKTKGGELRVYFSIENQDIFKNIWLEGAATFVFEGKMYI